ncbi:MAG: amidohydrolase family protein [bacterium]|nr:amidohydrolase family protein [bacterium]
MIVDINTSFGFYPYRKIDTSLETLRSILKSYHSKAFSLSLKGIFYDAIEGNEETLNLLKDEKELYPIATYDPRAYPKDIEYLENLREKGFLAIAFFPRLQGWVIDFAPFREVIEVLSRDKLPIIIHTSGYGELTKISSIAKETGFPFIISGFHYSNLSEAIAVMRKTENIYIETHLLNSPDALEYLKKYVGTDRVIFGSGTPLLSFETALNVVTESTLSEDEKESILSKNLEKILGVKL